jgi:S1-C subfamily serine protease
MPRFFSSRIRFTVVLTFASLLHALPARGESAVHDKLLRSTAFVLAPDGKRLSYGTGCLVDRERQLFVTCRHVVNDQPEAFVIFPIVGQGGGVLTQGKDYQDPRIAIKARVVATDSRRDLAILRLEHVPADVRSVELVEDAPKPGDTLYGVGNSGNDGKLPEQFVLWKQYQSKFIRSVFSTQFIKNIGQTMDSWAVEVEGPLEPGDSGGPLVDGDGRLVGVVYCVDGNKGYAVDVGELRLLLDRLKKPMDLTGAWTARLAFADKQPAYLKVNFREGGVLEWTLDKAHVGRYELHDDRLTLTVPSLGMNETVTIIRRGEASFSFQSGGVPVTFSRR